MDEQDKTRWPSPAGDLGAAPAGVDLLAGASAKTEPDPHQSEGVEQEEAFLPPWMAPESHEEKDEPDARGPSSAAQSPDQLKKAIGLAIADVRNVSQGQGEARDAATILQGQSLDPKTAAVVASAMASVFSGLSDTRFSAQGGEAKQQGFEGYDDAEKILRNMMRGGLSYVPAAGKPEPHPQEFEEKSGVWVEEASEGQQPPVEVVEDDPNAPGEAPGSGGRPGGGPRPKGAVHGDGNTRQRQVKGRGKNPYYGIHGRKKPQRIKIARSARTKGMRGQPNLAKTELNLAVKVKTLSSPSRAIPLVFLTLLVIAAFAKFGVIDQYQRLAAAQSELAGLQQESSQITATIPDYVSVQQQYVLYDDSWLSEQEKLQVDAMKVMDLIRRDLPPGKVRLASVTLNSNDLEVEISGVDLQVLARLVETLKKEPLVRSALVQDMSRTDEVPAGAAGGALPGTFTLIITLGELPPDTSAPDATVPVDNGQDQAIPATGPEAGDGQLPEDPEPVIPERPVLPGEPEMGG